jgi:uncharacterized protein YukE
VDIPFPSQLQWVTPLVGSHWPQGSESAWWRSAGYLRDTASELEAHISDLNKVRSKTQAVLVGETAQAFDESFAQLFSGNTAMDKKVEALRSLGDAAEALGSEIQYTKLSIYSMLVIAAGSIIFALANSEWTLGASLAQIPVIRWLTENAITRLVTMVLGRIEAELAARLGSMLVARLVVEGAVSAGIGTLQEGGIEVVQVAEGHREGIDVGTVLHSALSMGLAGMAGGLAGHAVGGLVGAEGSTAMRALKGAVTGLASGEAANVAGTLAGGGHVGTDTLLGGAIGLAHGGLGGANGEHGTPVQDPTETPMPGNAIDTHPTLVFEKQPDGTPDGTFAWPGEHAGAAGDTAARATDGAPQAIAAPQPAPAADPAGAAGDRATGSPSAATEGEGGTASRGANESPGGSDSAAKSSSGSTAATTSAQGEVEGPTPGSVNATPAVPDAAASPAARLAAGLDSAPATNAPLGSGIPEGRLDLSTPPRPVSVGPVAEPGNLAVSDLIGPSAAAGLPAGAPDIPRGPEPDPIATSLAMSDRGSSVGPPSPTPDARAGLAESSSAAGESTPQPAAAAAARTSDTTATQAGPRSQLGDLERVAAGQAGKSVAELAPQPTGPEPAPASQAGQPRADAHLLDGNEGKHADSRRTTDPLTPRRDPARPDNTRDDSNRPGSARPEPRRSSVARDVPKDLQPTAATRAQNPLAAAKDIGVIEAHRDDSGAGPGQPDSHQGGHVSSDDHNTPDPATAGAGAGDYRGGDGDNRGGASGHGGGGRGAGHGGAGPGDGGGAGDPPDRGDSGNRDGDGGGDRDGEQDHGAADHASSDVEARIPPKPGPLEPLRLESQPQPIALRIRGLEHTEPLRINPGSDLLLGRAKGSPLHELLSRDDHASPNHASIGVHPSGRVWIRDNGSNNGTWLNGKRIKTGPKIALRPADVIRIGHFETTVDFTAPPLPHSIELVDRSAQTMKALEDMALIPPAVYDRIIEHLEAISSGGVTLGKRALADLPRVVGILPSDLSATTAIYISRFRRILVDTRVSFAGLVHRLLDRPGSPPVLHEFGHAADHAYGDGTNWLSDTPEWATVHELVRKARRSDPLRNRHLDKPREVFAEGFASWLLGDEALRHLANFDAAAAAKLREYYDTVFGPIE